MPRVGDWGCDKPLFHDIGLLRWDSESFVTGGAPKVMHRIWVCVQVTAAQIAASWAKPPPTVSTLSLDPTKGFKQPYVGLWAYTRLRFLRANHLDPAKNGQEIVSKVLKPITFFALSWRNLWKSWSSSDFGKKWLQQVALILSYGFGAFGSKQAHAKLENFWAWLQPPVPAPKPVATMRAGLAPPVMLEITEAREALPLPLIRSSIGCKTAGKALVPLNICTPGFLSYILKQCWIHFQVLTKHSALKLKTIHYTIWSTVGVADFKTITL